MFQQPAEISMMIANAGRHFAKRRHKSVVHEKAVDERAEMMALQSPQNGTTFLEKLANVLFRARQELAFINLIERHLVELGENDLKRALEKLNLAFDPQEVPFFKGAKMRFVGVPHP